jgi:phospholipase C
MLSSSCKASLEHRKTFSDLFGSHEPIHRLGLLTFDAENRAFDHYFGTMPGVRGFNDPNIHYNGNRSVWDQLKSDNQYMSPWYLNYQGQKQLSQCVGVGPGPNWEPNRKSYNYGDNDMWPIYESPVSVGFFKKDDIPTQYSVADNWVVGDMYQVRQLQFVRGLSSADIVTGSGLLQHRPKPRMVDVWLHQCSWLSPN